MNKRKGQSSLILILLAAMTLVFFAVSLNWGRIAQIKTLTTVAATESAAVMVSDFASYGEQVLQTTLGGRWQICKSTSVLVALITLIIVIVITVVSCFVGCEGVALWGIVIPGMVLGGLAIAVAAINLVLQVTVVQPGLTRLWNKMQNTSLSQIDQFLEQGIQSALQNAVSDPVQITDYQDLNTNGRFGNKVLGATTVAGNPEDAIPRFGFYYTERLRGMNAPSTTNLGLFLNELENFSAGTGPYATGWPLTVHCDNFYDPHCNDCCIIDSIPSISRPSTSSLTPPAPATGTCDPGPSTPMCNGSMATANGVTPLPWPYAPFFPLAYDPTYPNYKTHDDGSPEVPSFLAGLGIDAEVRPFQQTEATGLFSLLWRMDGLLGDPNRTPSSWNISDPAGLNTANLDTRDSDHVTVISSNFRAADNECAESKDPLSDFWWKPGADQYCSTTWPYDACAKYNGSCTTTMTALGGAPVPSSCGCNAGTATQWPEDPLDDLVYNMKRYYSWAKKMTAYNTPDGIVQLQKSMDKWYPEALKWVGEVCTGGNDAFCFCDDPSLPPGSPPSACSVGSPYNGGYLLRFSNRLTLWKALIDKWKDSTSGVYADDQAWCVPATPAGIPNAAPNDEYSAIVAGGVTWGSLPSVVQCLKYETDDKVGHTASYELFKKCHDDVEAAAKASCPVDPALPASCSQLPRSLWSTSSGNLVPLPAYDPCATPSKFLEWQTRNELLARVQFARLAQRAAYLDDMLKKANAVSTAIDKFVPNLKKFLASGGMTAMKDAYNNDFKTFSDQLPNQVLYGWRDENPPASRGGGQGYWHMVRVKMNVPGRCSSGVCGSDRLPWVRTYTKGFLGLTRCYELTDYRGMVIASVTRWDEDHDPLTFANKLPLWTMLFHNPNAPNNNPGQYTPSFSSDCADGGGMTSWRKIGMTSSTFNALFSSPSSAAACDDTNVIDSRSCKAMHGAFMISGSTSDADGPPITDPLTKACWERATNILKSGIKSQVCAAYGLDAAKAHFDMKFVDCGSTRLDP